VTPSEYEYLQKLLKERSGLILSADKQYLVESRLIPLARRSGLNGISELVAKMKTGAEPVIVAVVEAMTTNETFFFRDKVPFDHFRETILPSMMEARKHRRSLRIWCAASSTGSVCARSTRRSRVVASGSCRPTPRSPIPSGIPTRVTAAPS
jgi:chemotaxis protein methyltransferase CheR